MTDFRIVRKNRVGRLVVEVGERMCVLEEGVSCGLERMMELRGWTAQQAFDHLMASHHDRPWHVPFRIGRLQSRRRILSNEALGPLHVERLNNGELRAYRQVEGQFSTSFVVPPRSWDEHLDGVCAGGGGPRRVPAATETLLVGLLMVPREAPPR